MKINLKNAEDDNAILLESVIDSKTLDLDIGIMHFPEEIRLRVEAWKTGDDLTVNAHVEGDQLFTCSRCLEEFDNLFEKDFTLHYDIKGLDSVNIDQEVREELMLECPIRILCEPDCKGLCVSCGANLNEGLCGCRKESNA